MPASRTANPLQRAKEHAFYALSYSERQTVNLYISRRTVKPGERVGPPFQESSALESSILVFADLEPRSGFGHRCRYVLYDPDRDAFQRVLEAQPVAGLPKWPIPVLSAIQPEDPSCFQPSKSVSEKPAQPLTRHRSIDLVACEAQSGSRSVTGAGSRAVCKYPPLFCAASGSGASSRDAAQIWAIGLAVAAVQSWRVSMNSGNCRVVLAWCSPRVGYSATSFGHSSARAVPASSSARTVNVWVPTSTAILGLVLRL